MTQPDDIAALVLAAGLSSRMKRFKPLLPLGPTTVVERCVKLFRDAGICDIRVVVGHRADDLIPHLERLGVRWIVNNRFQEGMFSSVQAGAHDLESSRKAFFMLPVDIPLIRKTTVLDLLQAFRTEEGDVWHPTFMGRRGHPPLISTKFRSALLVWGGEGGLRAFLAEQHPRTVDVEVADEHILIDMDSPEHYKAALAKLTEYDFPSNSECKVLLTRKIRVDSHTLAHSMKVAQVAVLLARALNERNCSLNMKLIEAAALLHDIAKDRPNHAEEAAKILRELGYDTLGWVVSLHMDVRPTPEEPISPQEIVCLADKIVQDDRIVAVEERFKDKLWEKSHLAAAQDRRLLNILNIKGRIEKTLGTPIENLLSSAPSLVNELIR
ncbi:DVU_1551 family NTP transferase [Desulfomonile tiedjei]|uniref:Putative domain HDIG-containing protein n=1 Tax=Desulfomonile tiedjei (strain ATCC 49306 / DSM 6799 / DCB-1) TaxID=706587 RepID=I4C4K9_DESTA|nr:NTP transferase domain-containing protein [Desulfomonile tiedjei]AFM24500.1 putative domain HDIG-containing protein [Desulfomonile tiedjei DSM 6799]